MLVLEHFRYQLAALSDKATLELLRSFQDKPFMNAEARRVLQTKRQTTWAKLAVLVQLGLVEKRGHVYRVSPFAKEFVEAASTVLQGILAGVKPRASAPESLEALKVAIEGIDFLFSRGRLGQEEYTRYREALVAIGDGRRA